MAGKIWPILFLTCVRWLQLCLMTVTCLSLLFSIFIKEAVYPYPVLALDNVFTVFVRKGVDGTKIPDIVPFSIGLRCRNFHKIFYCHCTKISVFDADHTKWKEDSSILGIQYQIENCDMYRPTNRQSTSHKGYSKNPEESPCF